MDIRRGAAAPPATRDERDERTMDDRFQKVWSRVTASKPAEDDERLRAFLADEQKAAAEYADLARRTGAAPAKRLFMRLANEERDHAKQLEMMLYMLNGGIHPLPQKRENSGRGKMLQALRSQYAAEQRSVEAYSAAAAETRDQRLSALYSRLAADEQKHGDALLGLLQRLM